MSGRAFEADEPDAVLMALSAEGDRSAFDRLARRHAGHAWRLALRLTGDPDAAEEVAQEALLRAWRSAARYDPARGAFTTWLHRIVINLAADRRRAAGPAEPLAEAVPDPAPAATAALEAAERSRHLAAGLAALPPRQQQAIALTYFEERAGNDAAAVLGISTRALEGLLRRARRFLREWLHAREAWLPRAPDPLRHDTIPVPPQTPHLRPGPGAMAGGGPRRRPAPAHDIGAHAAALLDRTGG